MLQNFHRYGLLLSAIFLIFLAYDLFRAFWFTDAAGARHFGMGLGTVIMLVNWWLLFGYTFGCHATRHIVGGLADEISTKPLRWLAYRFSTVLNRAHMRWAWFSLFSVALTDLYIRLCSMGVLYDVRLF